MYLTDRGREHPLSAQDSKKFPTSQLALLALVRLAEPIALTSIYPYAWKLVLHFHICDKSHASFYSGLLISAFALAESLTGMWWGGVSDRTGRKPVLLFGCLGTIASLLVVGFAGNFWVALFGRALGGLLNGNIGVIQTMVGELVTVPEHEPRAFAIMPMVWAIGTILGPVIGGCFAEPSQNFPSFFSPSGVFGRFPFLLPNLICATILLVAVVVGFFLIGETHPDWQPENRLLNASTPDVRTPLIATSGAMEHTPSDLRDASCGTFNVVLAEEVDETHTAGQLPSQTQTGSYGTFDASLNDRPEISTPSPFNRKVLMLVLALGIFTYHSMTYDVLISIFLEDPRGGQNLARARTDNALSGGVGLSMSDVGGILAVNGFIALFIQAVLFPFAASRLGIWKLLIFTTFGHPLAYLVVPCLVFVPLGALYPAIYACLSLRNIFSIIAYPVLLILIKEAAPGPSSLGKINGLAASVGAASRTIASPVAGLLYGQGTQLHFTPLAWWASAFVATLGVGQLYFVKRQRKAALVVKPLTHFLSHEDLKSGFADEPIHIYVESVDGYSSEEETL